METTPLEKEKVLEKIKNGEVKVSKKSVIQKEGAAHHKETEKLDKALKPAPVEQIPEKPKEKKKPQKTETPTQVFPCNAQINPYGFLGFKKAWLDDLGWEVIKGKQGVPLIIEKNADGSITLRKT